MRQFFPPKGTKPVAKATMLNFLDWLSTSYPAIKNLQTLQDETLLQLVREFERSHPRIPSATPQEWFRGFELLSRGS